MNNEYINELFNRLEYTEFWESTVWKSEDYTSGIQALFDLFSRHKKMQSQVYFAGNGGSAAVASHMTTDFMKNGGMRTCSLGDSAVMTCMGNDYGYEYIYSKQIEYLAKPGDLLVAISSSGNSANIINTIEAAKKKGAVVITLTGFKPNNKARQMGDFNVYVPCEKYGMVESIHNLILQQVVDMILERDGIEH